MAEGHGGRGELGAAGKSFYHRGHEWRGWSPVVLAEGDVVEENVALTRRWLRKCGIRRRVRRFASCWLAPDCVAHGTSETGGDLHGPGGFLELHKRLVNAFPDMHMDLQDCFGAGDQVAVRWTATMHHHGNALGMEASGAEVKINGMGFARLLKGK